MLRIDNLSIDVDGNQPFSSLNLQVNPGEIHVLMGTNGAGKSSLAKALIGDDDYQITAGRAEFRGRDITTLSVEERARSGLFLAFQHPIAIPGVNNLHFLKAAVNAKRLAQNQELLDALQFIALAQGVAEAIQLPEDFLYRDVNDGFSGGERKRNELLQLLLLEPDLAVLDELDSGLDVDALKLMAARINQQKQEKNTAFVVISHYLQWIESLNPDYVHVLKDGSIVETGDISLAQRIALNGFDSVAA